MSGCGKTTLLINLLLRPSWLDYNNNLFGKSLFQPEYHILKKAFEEKLPKEIIIRLFKNQNEITDLHISPISVVEEMAKDIRDKSDIVCNFYQLAEDVPDPRELSSEKKNLMVFDDLLLEKHVYIALCQRKTQQVRLFLFKSKLFQAPTSNNLRNLNHIVEDHVGSDMTREE